MNIFSKFKRLQETKTFTIDGENLTVQFRALTVAQYREMLSMGTSADYHAVLHGVYDPADGTQMFKSIDEVQELPGAIILALSSEVGNISTRDLLEKKVQMEQMEQMDQAQQN